MTSLGPKFLEYLRTNAQRADMACDFARAGSKAAHIAGHWQHNAKELLDLFEYPDNAQPAPQPDPVPEEDPDEAVEKARVAVGLAATRYELRASTFGLAERMDDQREEARLVREARVELDDAIEAFGLARAKAYLQGHLGAMGCEQLIPPAPVTFERIWTNAAPAPETPALDKEEALYEELERLSSIPDNDVEARDECVLAIRAYGDARVREAREEDAEHESFLDSILGGEG